MPGGAGRSVALFTQDTANGVGCGLDSGDGVPLAERNATSARRASIGDHIQGCKRLHEVEVAKQGVCGYLKAESAFPVRTYSRAAMVKTAISALVVGLDGQYSGGLTEQPPVIPR